MGRKTVSNYLYPDEFPPGNSSLTGNGSQIAPAEHKDTENAGTESLLSMEKVSEGRAITKYLTTSGDYLRHRVEKEYIAFSCSLATSLCTQIWPIWDFSMFLRWNF